MKKYDLLCSGDNIIRILDIQDDRILMIDCVKHTMPVWRKFESVDSVLSESELLRVYSQCSGKELSVCTDNELLKATGFTSVDIDTMDAEQRKVMHERYTMIAPILPFLSDDKIRSKLICSIAEEHKVSKQTVRNYLCLYLSYLDVTILAPKKRKDERELTQDEKYMRWALNKFFYTTKKQSLMTAYTMMLKEKYCDASGVLEEEYPSFYQFRYFYRKTRKMQNFYISRDGLKNYQRNNRPLIGEGVQEFAPAVGVGMLDATVCDIYLINDEGNLVGRPILTACIDAYSSMCCGYSLSWEGGVYSLRGLMLNIITDKVAWCRRFGISIEKEDWDCDRLPGTFVTDMGSEYKSENFEQIAELGVTVVNLPSYRPELKGLVEKFFDLVQEMYKKHLKGKGVIEPDYQERGAHDYRKDACLTMMDFEKIILHCMIYYNSKRIIENFPYTEAMINAQVKPHASCIWEWGKSQIGANLINVDSRELILTLLPRTTGKFGRTGLKVNKLRYHCEGYTEQYLSGGTVMVAYNPENVTSVWVIENGIYTEFILIESRFQGKDLVGVQEIQTRQRIISKNEVRNNLQAQIDLAQHIETIAGSISGHRDVHMKNIRHTNADGIVDGEDEYSDMPIYYYGETEISEEEYTSYQILGEYETIKGTMSADAMIGILSGDDEVTENTLEDSAIAIEDYYRLSGIYSDSMGESNLSISIYTSQEDGEAAIGSATVYTDEEEIYLGEIWLLEEGAYKIEMVTGDEIILRESEGEDVIVLQMYGNGEYLGDYRMIEHYES